MTLQETQDLLKDVFCDRRVHYAGLVELTKSRMDSEIVEVLRKVGQTNNFQPLTYEGGVLVFYTVSSFTVEGSTAKVPLTITVISDNYDDYKLVISALYDLEPLEVSLDSQSIYNKYFVEDENRPFQNYASEYRVTIVDNFSLCCEEYTC